MKAKGPTSAKHLWELLQDCWKTISGDYLLKLVKRMPRVYKAVIKAKGTMEGLDNFINTLNNNSINVKLTFRSGRNLDFLDLNITASTDGCLHTDVFRNPTATNSLLKVDSSHPRSTIRGIHVSQFLKTKRICSDENRFKNQAADLMRRFIARGYSAWCIKRGYVRAKKSARDQLLYNKPSDSDQVNGRFISTYNRQWQSLTNIIRRHWEVLLVDPILKKILPPAPSFVAKRSTNFKDILVRSRYESPLDLQHRRINSMLLCWKLWEKMVVRDQCSVKYYMKTLEELCDDANYLSIVAVKESTDPGNIFEFETTGGGKGLDMWLEREGRVEDHPEAPGVWDWGYCRKRAEKKAEMADRQCGILRFISPSELKVTGRRAGRWRRSAAERRTDIWVVQDTGVAMDIKGLSSCVDQLSARVQKIQDTIDQKSMLEPRIPIPDLFFGDRIKFLSFKNNCKLFLALKPRSSGDPVQQVRIVISFLRGDPQDWAFSLASGDPALSNIDAFFLALGLLYDEPNSVDQAEKNLLALCQAQDEIEVYCQKFRKWSVLTQWNESALAAIFRKGLSEALKDVMVGFPMPAGLNESMSLAIQIGRRLRERKSVHHLAVLPELKPEPMQCDRTLTRVERQEHRRLNGLCFYCGDSTHAISDCPKRTKRFARSATIGTVQSKFLLSVTLICSLSSYSVMAFLDSSTALNLMDLEYAKRCGFFLEPLQCPIPLRGIDATPLAKNKPQYWTQLTMCMAPAHQEVIRFLVLHNLHDVVVLGVAMATSP
ncbi:unnamed protein product [Ranitomeya imitator]|uniref:CCHC-type domain-containing protein n=1 Tax=Ranitomeya imitator TaxID=111125 RepID=A0ABN9L806_9NEOB|nr:unnamed protein product [Ranitomeya imitator]